ncbi:MAG: zinc-ribbon domain-containing protein [Planctomycetaceae bacterium]
MAGEITTRCPECKSILKLKDNSTLEKKVRCPKCKQPFVVKEIPQKQGLDPLDEFDDTPAMPPVTRKRTTAKKSGRKRAKSKSGHWPVPAIIAGGCVLAVMLIVGAILMLNRNSEERESNVVAQNDAVGETNNAGSAQNVDNVDVATPAAAVPAQNPHLNSPQITPAGAPQPDQPPQPAPQSSTRPDPIEIVVSNPKVVRRSHGEFEVELPYSTVGEFEIFDSRSVLEVKVRPSQEASWVPAHLDNLNRTVMDKPEGTIRERFKVLRRTQTGEHFLDDLKAGRSQISNAIEARQLSLEN